MSGPNLCRPRQQTSFKICCFFRRCSWVRVVAHSRDLREEKKKTKHWNHVWARPVPAEAADLFQNRWFVLCCCCCFVFFCFPLCSWARVVAHSWYLKKNQKPNKTKTTTKLNHVWARPVPAEAASLFQNRWFLFLFFFCCFLFVPESVWWHTHGGPCLEKLVYGRILLEGGPSSRKACLEKLSLSAWAQ